MPALLVPFSLAALASAFAAEAQRNGEAAPWRTAILRAAVVCGTWTAVITEAASAVGALRADVLAVAWAVLAAAALMLAARRRPALALPRPTRGAALGLTALLGAAVIAATTLAIAWSAPPNTWDSMTYHMSRVAHWIQNRSVAFYPSHIPRQLIYAPFAETAILHLQLLSGGDRLANLVQWSALLGCMAGVGAMATRLRPATDDGSRSTAGALAALYVATCPMAILQASSTQNDAVAAFWLVCIGFFVLEFHRRPSGEMAVLLGLSLGLGVLTKVTVYVFALPWLAWFVWEAVRRHHRNLVTAAAVAALVVNAGHYTRSLSLWARAQVESTAPAAPAAPSVAPPAPASLGERVLQGNQRYLTSSPSPLLVLSSLARNAALELASPFAVANGGTVAVVEGIHQVLGVAPNDARATYPAGARFGLSSSRHEDDTGNPLHFLLAAWATLTCLRRSRRGGPYRRLSAVLIASFLLFSAVFKWQPWHTRLLLPLLVLAAPLVEVRLQSVRWRAAGPVAAAVLWLASLPWLLFGEPRALLGRHSVLTTARSEQYFANRPDLRAPYVDAVAFLRASGCDAVGLVLGGNDWEYPLWPLLAAEAGRGGVRIEHVLVANPSRWTRPGDTFTPCAIVLVAQPAREEIELRDVPFALGFREATVQVFHR